MSCDFRRIFRTVPELDEADKRAGATFVNILFGLVVTTAAIRFATELVNWWAKSWDSVDETRLAHLVVAITLTVLSWIGYHQSQQYPPFLIKFLNIPFFQFVLDVTMVVAYYVVVALAENSDPANGAVVSHDALPEAILIFIVFVLYSLWDLLGFRLFHDPEYARRLRSPRRPDDRLGPRRIVTFVFTAIVGVQALVIWRLDLQSPTEVIVADAIMVVILIVYRLCKPLFDPRVKTRSSPTAAALFAE